MSRPNVEGVHKYLHCPYCGTLAEYNHRDGTPVCKCPVKTCKGHERWLEYDDFAEQRQARRVRSRKRLLGTKPHIYFEAGSWCVCYNINYSNAVFINQAKLFVFCRNKELAENGL